MDKKGIGIFLGVIVVVGLVVQALYSFPGLLGLSRMAVPGLPFELALLWLPALAAFLAAAFTRDPEHPGLRVWPVPVAPALAATVGFPLAFIGIYGVSMLLGWVEPDWEVRSLVRMMPENIQAYRWGASERTSLAAGTFLLSVVAGPTLLAVLWLGNEIGWRAYLLPKLLPLGRVPAYLIGGALWGLWLAWLPFPLPDATDKLLVARYVLLGVALGSVLAETWRRSRHVGLAAVLMGCYAAQAGGIWPYVAPVVKAPWAGDTGLLAIACWSVLAAALILWPARKPAASP